ncbi:TM2 domain-containing protein [Candidatus Electronema halotolerans]
MTPQGLILIVLCVIIGFVGRHRKFGFWGYFFCSVLLTPVIGALVVLASDPKKPERNA